MPFSALNLFRIQEQDQRDRMQEHRVLLLQESNGVLLDAALLNVEANREVVGIRTLEKNVLSAG